MDILIRPVGPLIKIRPSTAALRRMLKDKSLSKAQRAKVYSWLQYRKRHTGGR